MATNEKIKVLLVDDHKIVRDGLKVLLQDEIDIEVIGEAENGKHALEKLTEITPNLLIIDINMPVMNGIECTHEVVKNYPSIGVLALTMLNEQEHIKNMIAAGAKGYILKNSGKDELVAAIKTVTSGQNYFSDEVKNIIMMNIVKKKAPGSRIFGERIPLTNREKDVLEYIVKEFTNQEIAEKLFISVRTVDAHRRNLLEKTGARNTAGLVKYALESKLFADTL
jgi:DNA-binding NarL/FixJ family response regulator